MFTIVDSTICNAYMLACGQVNDHLTACFRNREVGRKGRQAEVSGALRKWKDLELAPGRVEDPVISSAARRMDGPVIQLSSRTVQGSVMPTDFKVSSGPRHS